MNGFSLSRWLGILIKEFIQLKRDRLTFGMIIGVPILQLLLFGYAINADPRQLPTAVVALDDGPLVRSVVRAAENTGYFRVFTWTDPVTPDLEHQALVPMYIAKLINLDDPDQKYYELLQEVPALDIIPPCEAPADRCAMNDSFLEKITKK